MKKLREFSLMAFALLGLASPAYMQTAKTPPVEASNKYSEQDLASILQLSADHRLLYDAMASAQLLDILKGKEPLTVFAPDDAAMKKIREFRPEDLLNEKNREFLVAVLKYHVIKGSFTASDIMKIADRNGKAEFVTLQGQKIYAAADADGNIFIMDESGVKCKVTAADKAASNGILHVIDGVLMPEKPSM